MSNTSSDFHSFVTSLMAHDISNYNQTSRGYLEMLLEERMGPLTDEQARAILICLRQSARIQSLIESIRLVDDLNTLEVTLEAVDLDEAIREAIDRVQTAHPDREIRVRFTPGRRRVQTEPLVSTIFEHLLSNAVRHNQDLEIVEIDLQISEQLEPHAWLICVSDNGEGIPAAKQSRLFERLDNHDLHGHGLGLSVVKRLVERWGGKVWFDQEASQGQGAVFCLTLPPA